MKILESEKGGSPVGNTWQGKFVNDLYPDLNPSIDLSLCCPIGSIELESKFSIESCQSSSTSVDRVRLSQPVPQSHQSESVTVHMHLLLLPGLLLDLDLKSKVKERSFRHGGLQIKCFTT